jgi:hypothetical protein
MRDLYSGPPPSPTLIRELAAERAARKRTLEDQGRQARSACDRVRQLVAIVDALGDRLACLPDDAPGFNATSRLFHQCLARLREAEIALGARHDDTQ